MERPDLLLIALLLMCASSARSAAQQEPPGDAAGESNEDVINVPLERLLEKPYSDIWGGGVKIEVPVTTVSRQPSTVGRSPAAVFVVTNEMIRRSGARSIPEALRMVPGLHVARVDSSVWSISCRGFSSRFARKLLVQIDGRTVYTPLYGGTFWDVQDLLLEDVDRIEVIRGPGSTVWGVNAVNGIINVITKSADQTHGTFVQGGGGTYDQAFSGARVGNVTNNGVHWRVYAKGFERNHQYQPQGVAYDGWQQARVGFRTDWFSGEGTQVTTQGDLYTGNNGHAFNQPPFPPTTPDEPVGGGNVLGRVTHAVSEDSEWSLQTYYDRNNRLSLTFDQNICTWDIDFQHRFRPLEYHRVIWGAGYRRVWDSLPVVGTPVPLAAVPVRRQVELASAFVQDEFELVDDRWYLTAGAKLTDDSFTDFQVQPSIRLLYLPNAETAIWSAISRAVRIPSRMEHDGRIVVGEVPPPGSMMPLTVFGNPGLNAEETLVYELGLRRQPTEAFSWNLSLFYNVDQQGVNARPIAAGLQFFNGQTAQTYGAELAATWEVNEDWRLLTWYSFLRSDVDANPAAVFPAVSISRGNPRNQAYLMSSWDLTDNLEFDLIGRYVDNVSSLQVPRYLEMDVRLAWRPRPQWELSLVGQNLLDPHHPEYGTSLFVGEVPTEVPRSVYGMITRRY